MLKKKLIEAETVSQLYGARVHWLWNKWEPIIMELRERYNPEYMTGFEYLTEEMTKIAEQKGMAVKPEDLFPTK